MGQTITNRIFRILGEREFRNLLDTPVGQSFTHPDDFLVFYFSSPDGRHKREVRKVVALRLYEFVLQYRSGARDDARNALFMAKLDRLALHLTRRQDPDEWKRVVETVHTLFPRSDHKYLYSYPLVKNASNFPSRS